MEGVWTVKVLNDVMGEGGRGEEGGGSARALFGMQVEAGTGRIVSGQKEAVWVGCEPQTGVHVCAPWMAGQ